MDGKKSVCNGRRKNKQGKMSMICLPQTDSVISEMCALHSSENTLKSLLPSVDETIAQMSRIVRIEFPHVTLSDYFVPLLKSDDIEAVSSVEPQKNPHL